jgi:hypothetical protein
MITLCTCPVPTALPDVITGSLCYQNLGQIQKLIFWRRGNFIASVATAELETTWDTLLNSVGNDKAVVSPFISGAALTPGESRSYGGGNDVKDGIPIVLGGEASIFEANVLRYNQDTITNLKELMCEQLDVLFINENGQIGYNDISGVFYGFPISGLFVSDLALSCYSESNRNVIRFMLPSNWSNNFNIL